MFGSPVGGGAFVLTPGRMAVMPVGFGIAGAGAFTFNPFAIPVGVGLYFTVVEIAIPYFL
jgi:hypothetical protein